MLIRITRKLANYLDGVDLTDYGAGDVIDLPEGHARLLIAENWAVPYTEPVNGEVRGTSITPVRAVAADARSRTRALAQSRRLRRQMDKGSFDSHDHRRIEDEIREDLHDARAKRVRPRSR